MLKLAAMILVLASSPSYAFWGDNSKDYTNRDMIVLDNVELGAELTVIVKSCSLASKSTIQKKQIMVFSCELKDKGEILYLTTSTDIAKKITSLKNDELKGVKANAIETTNKNISDNQVILSEWPSIKEYVLDNELKKCHVLYMHTKMSEANRAAMCQTVYYDNIVSDKKEFLKLFLEYGYNEKSLPKEWK